MTSPGDLSERPAQLDAPDDQVCWPFGKERGFLLTSYTSEQLLAKRQWLESKNSMGDLTWLVEAIDEVLTTRGGL